MSRCTHATAANASSTALSMTSGVACETAISTKVPSSGRARRRLSAAAAIGRQYPFHAFGHVLRRQRRARDVADVTPNLEGAAAPFADELREPARLPHLAAVRLAI